MREFVVERHAARAAVLQALYAAESGGEESSGTLKSLLEEENLSDRAAQFAHELFGLVQKNKEWAEGELTQLAENWRLDRMAAVDRLVLTIGLVELNCRPDTPAKVVIDEAIELAKQFSTQDSFAFVNGILDRFYRLREAYANRPLPDQAG